MPKPESLLGTPVHELDAIPDFALLPHPTIRLEVFVHREMVSQWVPVPIARRLLTSFSSNRSHLEVRRALLRFDRWVLSIEKRAPRVRRLGCLGVRLWIGGEIIAAFGLDKVNFLASSAGAPVRPTEEKEEQQPCKTSKPKPTATKHPKARSHTLPTVSSSPKRNRKSSS